LHTASLNYSGRNNKLPPSKDKGASISACPSIPHFTVTLDLKKWPVGRGCYVKNSVAGKAQNVIYRKGLIEIDKNYRK
jgi:hypothetical protein